MIAIAETHSETPSRRITWVETSAAVMPSLPATNASIALDYMLNLTIRLMSGLVVDADRMRANLDSTGGLVYSSTVLLELVEMGLERDTQAYPLTQRASMKTWETGRPFRETLREEADAAGLTIDEARLDEATRPERFVQRLDGMFEKLGKLS